jgi:hypothetical protein
LQTPQPCHTYVSFQHFVENVPLYPPQATTSAKFVSYQSLVLQSGLLRQKLDPAQSFACAEAHNARS